jgi:hypothetical protein
MRLNIQERIGFYGGQFCLLDEFVWHPDSGTTNQVATRHIGNLCIVFPEGENLILAFST